VGGRTIYLGRLPDDDDGPGDVVVASGFNGPLSALAAGITVPAAAVPAVLAAIEAVHGAR
jgi:hypothetical protein